MLHLSDVRIPPVKQGPSTQIGSHQHMPRQSTHPCAALRHGLLEVLLKGVNFVPCEGSVRGGEEI